MTNKDSFDKDVQEGYQSDAVFRKILIRPESHPNFTVKDEFIWTMNRGGENVLCIPSSTSKGSTLYGRIIDQAHTIVGHFGPRRGEVLRIVRSLRTIEG
jgi:DNA-directed RNA polymerase subunit H (RpoH/RPB5)